METFNESIMARTGAPIVVSNLGKTDPQIDKVKRSMQPKTVLAQGYFKDLVRSNMTEAGCNKAYNDITKKIINNLIPTVTSEIDEITKIFQGAGLIKRNETVPKELFKLSALGSNDAAVPKYVGIKVPIPYELDLKKLCLAESMKEGEVDDHFSDIKAYWGLLSNGSAPNDGIVELFKKINDTENRFYSKAKDYNAIMAGKTLTRDFGVDALVTTHKACASIVYYPDPWISFCLNMCLLRLRENNPNWEFSFNLSSWESHKAYQSCTATYYAAITIYYKVINKMFGGCQFERNGRTY